MQHQATGDRGHAQGRRSLRSPGALAIDLMAEGLRSPAHLAHSAIVLFAWDPETKVVRGGPVADIARRHVGRMVEAAVAQQQGGAPSKAKEMEGA
jgi:hypothetical protein